MYIIHQYNLPANTLRRKRVYSRKRVIEKRDRVQTDNAVGNYRFYKEIFGDFECTLWRGSFLHTLRMICVSRWPRVFNLGTYTHTGTYLLSLYLMFISLSAVYNEMSAILSVIIAIWLARTVVDFASYYNDICVWRVCCKL